MKVYVCSPYETAPEVRALHQHLRVLGVTPTSNWAESAVGPEDFAKYSEDQLREFAEQNDRDLASADIIIVWSRPVRGSETYAEARYALTLGKRVLWVGRRTLSAWRAGVVRCEDIDDALVRIFAGAA